MSQPLRQCLLLSILLMLPTLTYATPALEDWRYVQRIRPTTSGLIKIPLPLETSDTAQADLADLRILDASGSEVPYAIEDQQPPTPEVRAPASFSVSASAQKTEALVQTGSDRAIEGLELLTPASQFVKSVRVEGSVDGGTWETLIEDRQIYRQNGQSENLFIALTPKPRQALRVLLDDQRSPPIAVSGIRLHLAAIEEAPLELPITLSSTRHESRESKLTLTLPAAHIKLAGLRFDIEDQLFSRDVSLFGIVQHTEAGRQSEIAVRIGSGRIFRAAAGSMELREDLTLNLNALPSSRTLQLRIANGDSPPLHISGARALYRPRYVILRAQGAFDYQVYSGNQRCPAPHYDIASITSTQPEMTIGAVDVFPRTQNASYRAPNEVPIVQEAGAAIDISGWRYRKALLVAAAGAQRVQLDPEILAHTTNGLPDLRLVRQSSQVPYIIERTADEQPLPLSITLIKDVPSPRISRWSIKLPYSGVPLAHLQCRVSTKLFERSLELYENVYSREYGTQRRFLGHGSWRSNGSAVADTTTLHNIELTGRPHGNALYLETDNADNAAIEISTVEGRYRAPELLFVSPTAESLYLYYGNPAAAAPRYDLSLVRDSLRSALAEKGSLGPEEDLNQGTAAETWISAEPAGLIFWGALVLVVIVLLLVIAKLLPQSK